LNPNKIKSIHISSLRGIKNLDLDIGGKNLIIFGENGTGKSSFVDALEFFFTDKISHLEGVLGLSLKNHGTHALCKPQDVEVLLEFNPGPVKLSKTFSNTHDVPSHLKNYFNVAKNGTFILRRSQILEFIHNIPSNRFRTIGTLLGIEKLDSIESIFTKVKDYFTKEIESKKYIQNNNFENLTKILGTDVSNIDNILPSLNEQLKKQNLNQLISFDDSKHYQSMLLKDLHTTENNTSFVIQELYQILQTALIEDEISERAKYLYENIILFLDKKNSQLLGFINFLKEGLNSLNNSNNNVCPLCENTINKDSLIIQLKTKLALLDSISEDFDVIKRDCMELSLILEEKSKNLVQIYSKLSLVSDLKTESNQFQTLADNLNVIIGQLKKDLVTSQLQFDNKLLSEIKKQIQTLVDETSIKLTKSQSMVKNADNEQGLANTITLIERIKTLHSECEKIEDELSRLQKHQSIADKMLYSYSEAKKLKIQQIYDNIQNDIITFYRYIHPNEDLSDIQLVLNLNRRASTLIKINEYNQVIDPRAFQSEGHLDSLGLCIFLAFVRRFNTDCDLVVLDDIVTTIDSSHRRRICQLLYEKFSDKQLIITTHDNIWNEQLISLQRQYSLHGKFINLKINSWTVDNGPEFDTYKTKIEKIEKKLYEKDKTGAANEIRQYLEALLKNICENLTVLVVYSRKPRYTISDLFGPSRQRITKLVKESEWKTEIEKKYSQIDSQLLYLNPLSHDSSDFVNVSIEELQNLLCDIQSLEKLLQCKNCNQDLSYEPQLNYICCTNSKCEKRTVINTK